MPHLAELLSRFLRSTGVGGLTPGSVLMLALACFLLYLGIKKRYEPLLLVPIGFGALLANLPYTGLTQEGGLLAYFYWGVKSGIFPPLIFLGVGALTDFGPLLANPSTFLLGAAAQLGIFTAALLKDIGKVVLSQYVVEAQKKINALVSDDGYSFREAEKEVIGIDHAELGGMVAEKWKFSSQMADIIRNHHLHDESAQDDIETVIVYLADTLCMMMGLGGEVDALHYRFHKKVIERSGFTDTDFQEVMAEFGTKIQLVEDLMKSN